MIQYFCSHLAHMVLTAHTITGVTIASLIPDKPLLGFVLGFMSHFLLDAIPHWDYSRRSLKEDKENPLNDDMLIGKDFIIDLLKISFDGILGLLISYLIFGIYFKYSLLVILSGAVGGMMPDALQFVYMKWRHEPLISLQRFHLFMHAEKKMETQVSYQ